MNKLLFALSMARRASKLTMGFDAVKEEIVSGRRHLVLLAADTGENTLKKIKHFSHDKTEVYISNLTQYDLSAVCGRLTGVLAITDENMAVLCKNALSETKEGEL